MSLAKVKNIPYNYKTFLTLSCCVKKNLNELKVEGCVFFSESDTCARLPFHLSHVFSLHPTAPLGVTPLCLLQFNTVQ